ncbi:MAG: TolC family protein [Sphingomonadales bacterium]|nr:TolC family protein [Sphingomonadales bacterium]
MLRIGCTAIPTVKATIPVGDGAALIARRPDIREAQSRLLAATARIGLAAADFYPRISLGGSAGLIGGGFDAILTPLISWSFINQGAIRAKVAAARGGQAAALASWDAAILRALREVETVLADYQAEHRRHAALALALRESEAASSRALVRYQLGADSFLVALDAERTRNEAALMLSSSNLENWTNPDLAVPCAWRRLGKWSGDCNGKLVGRIRRRFQCCPIDELYNLDVGVCEIDNVSRASGMGAQCSHAARLA